MSTRLAVARPSQMVWLRVTEPSLRSYQSFSYAAAHIKAREPAGTRAVNVVFGSLAVFLESLEAGMRFKGVDD